MLAELNKKVHNQTSTIHQVDMEVEDLKNKSLGKTLVFKNIKKHQSEETRDDTKMELANEIAKNMQDVSKEEIFKNIERAHRVTTANTNHSPTSTPPFLISKMPYWDIPEKIFVSQMYSKSQTERRNAALK